MRVILCLVLTFVAAGSSLSLFDDAEDERLFEELYNGCGRRDKKCFGENDVCLRYRNCSLAISIADTDNRSAFKIIALNRCNDPGIAASRDFFFGVGMTSIDVRGNWGCREPVFDDYRPFVSWKDYQGCPRTARKISVGLNVKNKQAWRKNCMRNKKRNGARPKQSSFQLSRTFRAQSQSYRRSEFKLPANGRRTSSVLSSHSDPFASLFK